ncbi:class I SAM-dependent methyltransferase [Candidatus Riflebacteria bacterium]
MSVERRFIKRYEIGDTPWDAGETDNNLIEVVEKQKIAPCKALEVGCGNGDNAIWLARKGFVVTGLDISDIAAENAREKAKLAGVECHFTGADFFNDRIPGTPFGFIFDRGCFHTFDAPEERTKYAEIVAANLDNNGHWLTLIGNADERTEEPGPPRRAANDIVSACEPFLEILLLYSSQFTSKKPVPPRNWVCLMKKR